MKSIINFVYGFLKSVRGIIQNSHTLFFKMGQYKTMITNVPIDIKGESLPWYTYPAIEYLKSFDFSGTSIFEWGCGNSSIFWSKRCKKIISCEDNESWYSYVSSKKKDNQDIVLCTDSESYSNAISKFDALFDIIVIDGKYREECTKLAPQYLKDGGFIIFDNSDWFPLSTRFLREDGFFQIDFSGFGPVNNYTWTTSLFFKYNSIFQKNMPYSAPQPIGGIRKNVS